MGNNSIVTYVQLHAANQAAAAGEKITQLVRNRNIAAVRADPEAMKRIESDPEARRRFENYRGPQFVLMPIADVRLYGHFGFNRSDMGIKYVKTFAAIALFVLLIACINFMNLATARSANRAREVGLRKVVGADRKSLIARFYGESVLTAAWPVSSPWPWSFFSFRVQQSGGKIRAPVRPPGGRFLLGFWPSPS
jgi:hypothetical protein